MFARVAAAAALSLGLSVPAAGQPAAVTIDVNNFYFAPKPIQLRAGQPVTLTFVNRASGSHDFTAHGFFQASKITAGAAPEGEIELDAHQTKSITLVPRAGTYHAHCSHFMHKQMGMTVDIVVS